MPKALVSVVAFNSDGYRKTIGTVSEQQIHQHDIRAREPNVEEIGDAVGIVIDPKEFPEMDRFVVYVKAF